REQRLGAELVEARDRLVQPVDGEDVDPTRHAVSPITDHVEGHLVTRVVLGADRHTELGEHAMGSDPWDRTDVVLDVGELSEGSLDADVLVDTVDLTEPDRLVVDDDEVIREAAPDHVAL